MGLMNKLTPYLGKYANEKKTIGENDRSQGMANKEEITENSKDVTQVDIQISENYQPNDSDKPTVVPLDEIKEGHDDAQHEISLDENPKENAPKKKKNLLEFSEIIDQTKELAETTKRKAHEFGEKTKEKASELKDKAQKKAKEAELLALELVDEVHQDMHKIRSPFDWPSTLRKRVWHVIGFPVALICHYTIPNLNIWGKKWWPLSIIISLAWISGFVYLMVELANSMGCILNVHPVVMGLTVLAVGTSFPDFISSIYSAKAGYGDMAVANCLGSNIFDVLLCLGLPWFLSSVTSRGTPIHLHEDLTGLFVWLALSWIFTVASLWRLKLEKISGSLLLGSFGVWILYVCLHSYRAIPF